MFASITTEGTDIFSLPSPFSCANVALLIAKKGERFSLSVVGNRYHGATFHNLFIHANTELLDIFDTLSRSNNFYYGRYDIMCHSIDDF